MEEVHVQLAVPSDNQVLLCQHMATVAPTQSCSGLLVHPGIVTATQMGLGAQSFFHCIGPDQGTKQWAE